MKVTTYGTRGSCSIFNKDSMKYGGNTTCLRIESECIPKGKALVVDAGTGYVPLSLELFKEKVDDVHILFTHYHLDHDTGLFHGYPTFMKHVRNTLYGPKGVKGGVKVLIEDLMVPDYFPLHHKLQMSHFYFKPMDFPETQVMLVHPEGGFRLMDVDQFERLIDKGSNLPCGQGKYPKEQFLIITMHIANHPQQTVSYRFHEMPTGKIFVFLTDHETMAANPLNLRIHLKNADLLIMDCQYTRERYEEVTAGWGHGTPDYCVKTAEQAGARRLGLTHHDPWSVDSDIDFIIEKALEKRTGQLEVFGCMDYQVLEVGNHSHKTIAHGGR